MGGFLFCFGFGFWGFFVAFFFLSYILLIGIAGDSGDLKEDES